MEPEPNPICDHEHRKHYFGGGLWVCFACWARLLLGGGRRAQKSKRSA